LALMTAAARRRSSALFSAPGFCHSARTAPRQAFGNQLVEGNRAEREIVGGAAICPCPVRVTAFQFQPQGQFAQTVSRFWRRSWACPWRLLRSRFQLLSFGLV